jgi:hypothetical protein
MIRTVYASESVTVSNSAPEWNWEGLKEAVRNRNLPLVLLGMDPELFPDDSEGLLGADILLMRESEWESLPPVSVDVTETWIAQGGTLYLLGSHTTPSRKIGLGEIRFLSEFPGEMQPVAEKLSGVENPTLRILEQGEFSERNWELRKEFPTIEKPIGVLIVSVIVIAAILGPLNMMVAFRKRRSLQLLWTTPMLSVGISLLVGLAILLGDGIGGHGIRAQRVLILPGQNLEVAWQEQVSRTGVLFRSGFGLEEGWWIKPVALGRSDINRPSSYTFQADGRHEGDWFSNRRLQAHVLQRTQSTRALVSVHWENSNPVVTSTVETPFKRLLYRDGKGTLWHGDEISPGQAVQLTRLRGNGSSWKGDIRLRSKSLFPPDDVLSEKEWFYAEGAGSERLVDTLKAISWEDHSVWFFGPVVEETP